MSHATDLLKAATIVRGVVACLNRDTLPCDTCGLVVQLNRREYQMAVELEAVIKKLEKFASNRSEQSTTTES